MRLSELERSLNRVYLRIYSQIKRDPNYPNNINAIQLKYDKLVYDNTRSAVQQAAIIANEKVNRIFKTQPYLTQKDLDLIKKQSEEQTASFWRKIYLDIFRKQEQRAIIVGAATTSSALTPEEELELELEPPPDVDMTAYLLSVAIASAFATFADATLLKTGELSDSIDGKPQLEWVAQVDERTCRQLPDNSPGCGDRNGTIYDYDDPELQIHMPGSVHPFCRCSLEPVD